jgi:hypothetical protein
MLSIFGPLSAYLKSLYGNCSGISFVDSSALESVIPIVSTITKYLKALQSAEKARWAGFMA